MRLTSRRIHSTSASSTPNEPPEEEPTAPPVVEPDETAVAPEPKPTSPLVLASTGPVAWLCSAVTDHLEAAGRRYLSEAAAGGVLTVELAGAKNVASRKPDAAARDAALAKALAESLGIEESKVTAALDPDNRLWWRQTNVSAGWHAHRQIILARRQADVLLGRQLPINKHLELTSGGERRANRRAERDLLTFARQAGRIHRGDDRIVAVREHESQIAPSFGQWHDQGVGLDGDPHVIHTMDRSRLIDAAHAAVEGDTAVEEQAAADAEPDADAAEEKTE